MFRPKEYGSAADNARAADRCRLGAVCRGSNLNAKLDTQLLKACDPCPAARTSVVLRKVMSTIKVV
jgi:hypothetical protein